MKEGVFLTNPWDVVRLDGRQIPGLAVFRGLPSLHHVGDFVFQLDDVDASRFEIDVLLWHEDQRQEWERLEQSVFSQNRGDDSKIVVDLPVSHFLGTPLAAHLSVIHKGPSEIVGTTIVKIRHGAVTALLAALDAPSKGRHA